MSGERAQAEFDRERQRIAVVPFSVLGAARRLDVTGERTWASPSSSRRPAGERQCLSGVAGGLVDPHLFADENARRVEYLLLAR